MSPFDAILSEIEREHEAKAKALGITPDELYERNRRRWESEERERERDAWIRAYRDDVSPKVLGEVFDGRLRDEPPLVAARKWADSERPMLILCGTVGTGKTVAAVSLVRRFGGEVVRAVDLPERVRPWGDERRLGMREMNLRCRFAVLDDLGAEMDSLRFHEALGRFVDARTAGARTVITANMARSEIRPRYGDRIADRLNDVAVALEFSGPSLRGQGAGL